MGLKDIVDQNRSEADLQSIDANLQTTTSLTPICSPHCQRRSLNHHTEIPNPNPPNFDHPAKPKPRSQTQTRPPSISLFHKPNPPSAFLSQSSLVPPPSSPPITSSLHCCYPTLAPCHQRHHQFSSSLGTTVNLVPSSILFSWVSRGWVVVGLAFSGLEMDLVIKIVQFLVDGF
nr:hypothetical protein CFP56_78836 [Quercus suber]